MTWSFDLTTAPRGKTVTSTRKVGKNTHEIADFVPEPLLLATKCGRVIRSYWIPEAGKNPARWSGLATGEQPDAWAPWPTHPFQAKASDDNGATGQAKKVPADRVTGDASRPSRGGDTPALITHKHVFLDDAWSG